VRWSRALSGSRRGKAVDLGCGEGRDTVYLAGAGFEVTAVDIAAAGVAKAGKLLEREGLAADLRVGDLASVRPSPDYDVVVANNSLQFLGDEARPLLHRWIGAAGEGCVHVVIAFRDQRMPAGPRYP
jgi:tellurite methyltransferase